MDEKLLFRASMLFSESGSAPSYPGVMGAEKIEWLRRLFGFTCRHDVGKGVKFCVPTADVAAAFVETSCLLARDKHLDLSTPRIT
jgi:hypothetical protein